MPITIKGILSVAWPMLREFLVGKRPTAEYLRKYQFSRFMLFAFCILTVANLYLLENAIVVAEAVRIQKSATVKLAHENHQLKAQVDDLRMVLNDQKARYNQHVHGQPFMLCNPEAKADTIGACIQ